MKSTKNTKTQRTSVARVIHGSRNHRRKKAKIMQLPITRVYKDSLNRVGLENFLLYFRYNNGITTAPARARSLAYIFCVYRYRHERIAGSREPRWRGGQIRNTHKAARPDDKHSKASF